LQYSQGERRTGTLGQIKTGVKFNGDTTGLRGRKTVNEDGDEDENLGIQREMR